MATEHARAFSSLAGVKIVGICSRTRARAEEFGAAFGARVFDDIDDLYRQTSADAVIVSVNELSTREVSEACFAYPWVCLIEKPVGIDLPEATRILMSSRSSGVRAFVALNRRSYSATRRVIGELSNDPSPRLISILDQQDLETVREAGRPEGVLRNYMFANSIHLIDYFSILARGHLASIDQIRPWTPDRPGFVVVALRYSSGDTGIYQAVWDGPGPWSVTVTNRNVRLELRPLERLGVQRRGERQLSEIPPDSIDTDFKPGLRWQAEQLVKALEGGPTMLASLEEATRSMAVCARIYGLETNA